MSVIYQKPPQNYQYIIGFQNIVDGRNDAATQTAPVTNGNLHLVTIPANTFVQNFQIVDVRAFGNITAHAASAVAINVVLNAVTTIFASTIAALASAEAFEIWLRFIRTASVNQVVMFGSLTRNLASPTANTAITASQGNRFFINPFNLAQDNTLQFQVTDAGGTEVITQESTLVTVQ